MKKFLLASFGLFLFLLISSVVYAVPVKIVYTGDNVINDWVIDGGGGTSSMALGPNAGTWQTADTYTADLAPGTTYQIIWQVEDYDDGWDIAGFLGEISSVDPMIGTISSSSSWDVTTDTDWRTATWASAKAYAYNGASGTPWGTTVSGISTNAQWIWTDNTGQITNGTHGYSAYQNNDQNIFVRATLETSSVPEPATMLLLGCGLIGLAGFGRKFKKV